MNRTPRYLNSLSWGSNKQTSVSGGVDFHPTQVRTFPMRAESHCLMRLTKPHHPQPQNQKYWSPQVGHTPGLCCTSRFCPWKPWTGSKTEHSFHCIHNGPGSPCFHSILVNWSMAWNETATASPGSLPLFDYLIDMRHEQLFKSSDSDCLFPRGCAQKFFKSCLPSPSYISNWG